MLAWVEAPGQLRDGWSLLGIQLYLGDMQPGVPQDDLSGCAQLLPEKSGAQDVMAVDDLLRGLEVSIEQAPIGEDHLSDEQVRIACAAQQVMEEDAILKRREGVDVLDIGEAAGYLSDDVLDIVLGQLDQRQQLRSEGGGLGGDEVRRDGHVPVAA